MVQFPKATCGKIIVFAASQSIILQEQRNMSKRIVIQRAHDFELIKLTDAVGVQDSGLIVGFLDFLDNKQKLEEHG